MEKPKQMLMRHANENPNQSLVVSEINGVISVDLNFKTAESALFMLFLMKKSLEDRIIELSKRTPTEASEPSA